VILKTKIFLVLVAFLCLSSIAFGFEIPSSPKGYVNDYANILNSQQKQNLEKKLENFERVTTNQVAVVIINTLDGATLGETTLKIGEKWKLGEKGKDNGIVLLIAIQDRKLRIEVGRGLQGVLPDGLAGQISRQQIKPFFQKKKYYEGVENGLDKIILAVKGEYKASSTALLGNEVSSEGKLVIFCLLAFIAAIAGCIFWPLGGIVGGVGAPLVSWFMISQDPIVLVVSIIFGFVIGCAAKFIMFDSGLFFGGGGGDGGLSGGGGLFDGGGVDLSW